MKSIGEIFCETRQNEAARVSRTDTSFSAYMATCEAGAKAVLLHAFDLLAAAGVTPADAARELRAGKTLEEVCSVTCPDGENCPDKAFHTRTSDRGAITNEGAFDTGPYPHPRSDDARERGPSFSARAGLRRARGG